MREQGLTEKEIEAARVFLLRQRQYWLTAGFTDTCNRCNASTLSYPQVKLARHYASKPHIAGAYGISLSRLTLAIKIAKVMEALDG